MPTQALSVSCLSFDEFRRLEPEWNELVLASTNPLPFLSHPWIRLWWEHFGADQEFTAVIVRRGPLVVAGLPLALRRTRSGLTVGEIVGTGPVATRGMGLADKADPPVREDAPEAVSPLVVETLRRLDRADVIDAKALGEASPFVGALASAGPRPASVRRLSRSRSPYLPLPRTWEEYLGSRSGNFRKHLRKYWRRLEERGKVEVDRLDGARITAGLAEVFGAEEASWKGERGTNLFRAPELRAFFADVIPEMSARGWIDLSVLRVDGHTAAYELCFDLAGRVFSYNGGFRAEFAELSPGTALTAAVLEAACARGRLEYDMLRGEEPYKMRWATGVRHEVQVLVPAPRLRARAGTFVELYLKAQLKQWPWLEDLADRASGLASRLRYRS